jgi:hypothetical protein
MEFHLPGPIRSFKDFFIHLGIVTLGILIALGLEQIVEAHHRAKIGQDSVAGFRRELAENREQVKEVMAATPALRAKIAAQIAAIGALREADKAPLTIDYPGIYFDFIYSASWETAIATQTLYYIPAADTRRYSAAYSAFRLFLDEERTGLATWQDLRSFGPDAAALSPEQRRALIQQLHRYQSYTYVIDTIGKGTLEACDQALQ